MIIMESKVIIVKRFNPEKELSKIKNDNKNKILYGIIALLLIVAVGSTYALYQVRHSNKLVYTTVRDFKKRDIYLSVLVDGVTQNDFPKNNEGKIYSGIECDKEYSEAYFDNIKWELHFSSKGPNKCTVKFETGNLPNPPELYQGMIPVTFSDTGIMYVADTNSDWYNYQDHRWANAVLVDASNSTIKAKYFDSNNKLRTDIVGKEVPMEEVLQMYVWIPRYKYQLWNVNNESKPKQIINIKFEKGVENTGDITCTYENQNNGKIVETCLDQEKNLVENGDWYTHPAFKFGNTDLKGFWVGKFEPSDAKDTIGRNNNTIDEITILPGKTSMVLKTVGTMFNAERDIENKNATKYNLNSTEIDTHMAKNMEWGAVSYLTQSMYGIYKDEKICNIDDTSFSECEVWINNTAQGNGPSGDNRYGGTYTGCVGETISAPVLWNPIAGTPAKCDADKVWNKGGTKASTTGNMYGVYDMVGGTWDYTMGVIKNETGTEPYYNTNYSGFNNTNMPDSKYYDLYSFSANNTEYEQGHLGDATRETIKEFNAVNGGWNNDLATFPSVSSDRISPWFMRGGEYDYTTRVGVFAFYWFHGGMNVASTLRSIITAEDNA